MTHNTVSKKEQLKQLRSEFKKNRLNTESCNSDDSLLFVLNNKDYPLLFKTNFFLDNNKQVFTQKILQILPVNKLTTVKKFEEWYDNILFYKLLEDFGNEQKFYDAIKVEFMNPIVFMNWVQENFTE